MRQEILIGEEVGIACGDDGIGDDEPRVAVVGVEAVAAPRVVGEHDLGADTRSNRETSHWAAVSLRSSPSVRPRKVTSPPPSNGGGAPLLLLAQGDESRFVLVRGPNSPSTRRSARGGGARCPPPPTWPAWRRTRTRCHRDGRRWPRRMRAQADRARGAPRAGRSFTGTIPGGVARSVMPVSSSTSAGQSTS